MQIESIVRLLVIASFVGGWWDQGCHTAHYDTACVTLHSASAPAYVAKLLRFICCSVELYYCL